MEDRYIQLREVAIENKTWEGTPKRVSLAGDMLTGFFEKTKQAQEKLSRYGAINDGLRRLEIEAKKITTSEQEKEMNDKIAAATNEAKNLAEECKATVDILSKEVDKNKAEFPKEPETRAMILQTKAIASKFQSVLKENQKIQVSLQSSIKERVKRQIKIVDNKLSPEEIDNLSENPAAFQELMEIKTLGKAHLKVYYKVEDIMEKYKGITKLENSIKYIMGLLDDIAFMVETQGELLDTIEKDLETAENYIKKGVRVLEKEKKEHKKRRARYCCILLILIIIIGVIAFPIINAFK